MKDKVRCPICNSKNVYGMSRVVGYYSIIENWNDSKQAELKDRQKGVYNIEKQENSQNISYEKKKAGQKQEAIAVIR